MDCREGWELLWNIARSTKSCFDTRYPSLSLHPRIFLFFSDLSRSFEGHGANPLRFSRSLSVSRSFSLSPSSTMATTTQLLLLLRQQLLLRRIIMYGKVVSCRNYSHLMVMFRVISIIPPPPPRPPRLANNDYGWPLITALIFTYHRTTVTSYDAFVI